MSEELVPKIEKQKPSFTIGKNSIDKILDVVLEEPLSYDFEFKNDFEKNVIKNRVFNHDKFLFSHLIKQGNLLEMLTKSNISIDSFMKGADVFYLIIENEFSEKKQPVPKLDYKDLESDLLIKPSPKTNVTDIKLYSFLKDIEKQYKEQNQYVKEIEQFKHNLIVLNYEVPHFCKGILELEDPGIILGASETYMAFKKHYQKRIEEGEK